MRADLDAMRDATPYLSKEPARRYKPDGRPLTTRVKASKQLSHTQVWNPHTLRNRMSLRHDQDLLAIKFVRDQRAARQYRFVYRNGELSRVQ